MTDGRDMRISIVVPHLNQREFLGRCLESLATQVASHDVEVIVVDNGSDHPPRDVCDRHSFVRLEHQATPGPGPARNRGVAQSTGDILAFIDADCVAHRGWLDTLVKVFANEPATMIVGGDTRISVANPARLTMLESYESVFAFRQQHYIEKLGFSGSGNLAMRREVYVAVGPFAGIDVAEDRDWGRRATLLGCRIKYVPEMIVCHPARRTFGELRRKWDRHISHDWKDTSGRAFRRLRWAGTALAVLASGVVDLHKVMASTQIFTRRERLLAALVLMTIRLYRAWRMAAVLLSTSADAPRCWNRTLMARDSGTFQRVKTP